MRTAVARIAGLMLAGVLAAAPARAFDPFGDGDGASREAAIEASWSGVIYSRFDAGFYDDRDTGGPPPYWGFNSKALLETNLRQASRWRLRLSGHARHVLDAGDPVAGRFEPELWEAFGVLERPAWELSVGQQIRRWGRGVPSIWDVLNPTDLSELFFIEDEFQKRPVPMARWTRYGEGYEIEAVLLPFVRQNRMPRNQSPFSPLSVRDLSGLEDFPLVEQALKQEIYPGLVSNPPDNFLHPELALRWTPYMQGFDLDFYLFWGYEDLTPPDFSEEFRVYVLQQPVPPIEVLRSLEAQEIIRDEPIYIQQPRRYAMAGGSASAALPGVSVRGELAVLSQMAAYNTSLEVVRAPAVQALVGVDRLTGERFLWSLSVLGVAILTDEPLYLLRRLNVVASGLSRLRPFDIDLWVELRGMWHMTQGDAWLSPSLLYDVTSAFQLQIGAQLLMGPDPTPFSYFARHDYAWLRAAWRF